MFLKISSLDAKTTVLESGSGPALVGHYMNASEFRVVAALLAAIGSAVPDSMIAIISGKEAESLPHPLYVRGGGTLGEMAFEDVRAGATSGWVRRAKSGVIFLPADRAATEEATYVSFAQSISCIVPAAVARSATSVADFERALLAKCVLQIDADYSEIEISVNDPSVRDVAYIKTAKVIADFNQA